VLVGHGAVLAITWTVFILVYIGLAVGRLPLIHLDRAGIALVGAAIMLVVEVVDFPDAVAAVDFPTIALLFGMMVVVAYLRLGGFFRLQAAWVLARVRSPRAVLATIVVLAGVLSAFLVNDVVCLALAPVVMRIARKLRRDPVPFLVALATSANVGSVGTITGNPQNMIIGSLSRMPYTTFAGRLGPVAAVGLVADFAIVALVYRSALGRELDEPPPSLAPSEAPADPAGPPSRELLPKGIVVLAATVALFFLGAPIAIVALGAAAVLMVGRVRSERIYRQIDWSLLVMFAGLFVVVHGFEAHVVSTWDLSRLASAGQAPVATLAGAAAALSNLVSNVPAVLLFKPFVASLAATARPQAWLTLAMASTLSGNLTPVASVANLIVIECARREGVEISFRAYCRVGVPVTIVTLALGTLWLAFAR
jgi:Na+/H+ antiporter NhaD/arsenite permease-like protein